MIQQYPGAGGMYGQMYGRNNYQQQPPYVGMGQQPQQGKSFLHSTRLL
jgi:hypothetical protein